MKDKYAFLENLNLIMNYSDKIAHHELTHTFMTSVIKL